DSDSRGSFTAGTGGAIFTTRSGTLTACTARSALTFFYRRSIGRCRRGRRGPVPRPAAERSRRRPTAADPLARARGGRGRGRPAAMRAGTPVTPGQRLPPAEPPHDGRIGGRLRAVGRARGPARMHAPGGLRA